MCLHRYSQSDTTLAQWRPSDDTKDNCSMNYLESELKVVGTRPVRPDGVDKVTGRALFAADTRAAGMLWGRIKRSPHAHAQIVLINTNKAEALPGVGAVVSAQHTLGRSLRRRSADEFSRFVA